MFTYDSTEYAQNKLAGTIVRLNNGEPIYVQDVLPKLLVSFIDNGGNYKSTHLKNVDVSAAPLGFIQEGPNAVYVQRIPKRKDWKQGHRSANCISRVIKTTVSMPTEVGTSKIFKAIIGFDSCKLSEGLSKLIEMNLKSLALNRHWAISKQCIFYKAKRVGYLDLTGPFPNTTFVPEFSYLESRFYEDCL
jgi:hypothetical protein